MKQRTLFGIPIVEVDDFHGIGVHEIVIGPYGVDFQGVTIRPAVAATPTDRLRFIVEAKKRPGLHTMEEMRRYG